MDSDRRIFKVHLTPEISIQELPLIECSMISRKLSNAWLVPCGEMLLLVGIRGSIVVSGVTFEVFRLDLSFEPALWLKVEKLEHWAIFISTDKRSQPLSCMNPEIWGGKSNCIYCYNHEAKRWAALELGKPLQGDGSESNSSVFIYMGCDSRVQPMWVVPSILSLYVGDGDDHDAWLIIFFGTYYIVMMREGLFSFASCQSSNLISWVRRNYVAFERILILAI
jgi:hypothetical protein